MFDMLIMFLENSILSSIFTAGNKWIVYKFLMICVILVRASFLVFYIVSLINKNLLN